MLWARTLGGGGRENRGGVAGDHGLGFGFVIPKPSLNPKP